MLGNFKKRRTKKIPLKSGRGLSFLKKSRKKQVRQEEIKKRKNFFPALIVTTFLWTCVFFTIYFVDPFDHGAIQMFLVFVALALIFSFSLLFANTRRGLIASLSIVIFLILRYLGIGNVINLLLLIGLAFAIEFYFKR